MANKSPTEISLMKGCAVKLDNDTIMTVGYLVHTEEHARAKSEYLYLARIDKAYEIQAETDKMATDSEKLKKWTWKGLQKYESVVYDGYDTNDRGSRWIKGKLRKALEWDQFVKLANGWNEKKQAYNENAKYATDDFILDDGTKVSSIIESKDKLLGLVGKTLCHKVMLKSQL